MLTTVPGTWHRQAFVNVRNGSKRRLRRAMERTLLFPNERTSSDHPDVSVCADIVEELGACGGCRPGWRKVPFQIADWFYQPGRIACSRFLERLIPVRFALSGSQTRSAFPTNTFLSRSASRTRNAKNLGISR